MRLVSPVITAQWRQANTRNPSLQHSQNAKAKHIQQHGLRLYVRAEKQQKLNILRKVSKTFFVFLFGTLVVTTCADFVKRYLATYARASEYLEVVQDQI